MIERLTDDEIDAIAEKLLAKLLARVARREVAKRETKAQAERLEPGPEHFAHVERWIRRHELRRRSKKR